MSSEPLIEPDPYFIFGESNSFKYSSRSSSACVLSSFPLTINLGFSSGFDFSSGPSTVLIGISVILNQNRLTGVQSCKSTSGKPLDSGFSVKWLTSQIKVALNFSGNHFKITSGNNKLGQSLKSSG